MVPWPSSADHVKQEVSFCGLMRSAVAVSDVFEPQLHGGIRAMLSQLCFPVAATVIPCTWSYGAANKRFTSH